MRQKTLLFPTFFSLEHLNAFARNVINQNQKAVQVAAFGIYLHQIQRWHATLYVRKYVKPDLQVSHQHRSLMDKVSKHLSLFPFSPECRIKMNQMFTQSCSNRIFSVAVAVKSTIRSLETSAPTMDPREEMFMDSLAKIANVVERLNLKRPYIV